MRIEAVHEAWSVLGHHLRRIYELVAYHGVTQKADLYAAAAVPRATGDRLVTDLEIAGLLTKSGWGTVAAGSVTLDAVAQRLHLEQVREERLERHRAERAAWRRWLDEREKQRAPQPAATGLLGQTYAPASVGTDDTQEHAAWQEAVMAAGPPRHDEIDQERDAIDIIVQVLGGRLLVGR